MSIRFQYFPDQIYYKNVVTVEQAMQPMQAMQLKTIFLEKPVYIFW